MLNAGHFTHAEILSQPEAWTSTLAQIKPQASELRAFFERGQFDAIRVTGCGSTYYLSLAAAALIQEHIGIEARGVPASELWLYPRSNSITTRKTLLIAVSRSGATTETLRAVERFRREDTGAILTLSCYPRRDLTRMGDLNLIFEAGQEESVAQTRAFSVLYLAAVALTMLWSHQDDLLAQMARLPDAGQRLLDGYAGLARQLGQMANFDRFYFLGSGPRYGLACELNLKMKEMSLGHSEAFHMLEFRHGPQSMVTAKTLMIGLLGETNQEIERRVLDEMEARGAQVVGLADQGATVEFASGVAEPLRNVLYLPFGQLLAYEHSLYRSLNPDRPNNLTAVVRLDQ